MKDPEGNSPGRILRYPGIPRVCAEEGNWPTLQPEFAWISIIGTESLSHSSSVRSLSTL
jgi:hypothetical protein